MTPPTSAFSKDHTNALKGVAICMLLWHHLFNSPPIIMDAFYLNGHDILRLSAALSRVSLYIFLILSAYGLYIIYDRLDKTSSRKILAFCADRYIALILPFILCFFLTVIAQWINGFDFETYYGTNKMAALTNAAFDMLGVNYLLHSGLGATINITWWYLSLIISVILAFPILYKFIDKYGYQALLIIPLIMLLRIDRDYPFIQYFYAVLAGMLLAKYNAIDGYKKKDFIKNKAANIGIKLLLAIAALCILSFWVTLLMPHYEMMIHAAIAIVLILTLYALVFSEITVLRNIFAFLGKLSGNIYYLHFTIFFYLLTDTIYAYTNPVYIFFAALAIMLIISLALEICKKMIRFDKALKALRAKARAAILKEK